MLLAAKIYTEMNVFNALKFKSAFWFMILISFFQWVFLDIELYKFAWDLLQKRFDAIKASDESYQEHISNIGKEKYEFSWSDIEDEN